MLTRHAILCPIDFSEPSRQALRWADALAAREEGRLVVLNVVDRLLAEAAKIRFGVDISTTETAPALREFVQSVLPGAAASDRLVLEVRIGDPPETIMDAASDHAVGLIVLGTHGLGGVRKWLLGSTTDRVLRGTRTPVLAVAVDPDETRQRPDPHAAVHTLRILVAADFRESSMAAVAWAAQYARRFDLPLVLAHVVEPLTVPAQWRQYVAATSDERAVAARARLDRLAIEMCDGRACETVVAAGRPEETLTAIARDRRADLIVMGLAGERDSQARRPGSIAYGVLRAAGIPVLVVPSAPGDERSGSDPSAG